MKAIPAILFLVLLPFFTAAQNTIKGRVVAAASGMPISGSSIFIANTSKGTVSGEAGQFELINVPAGKHELIISCIGYETNVFSFSDDQLPLQLKIEMTVKVKELQNVIVEPSVEEGWDKWGKVFLDNFIGSTDNAGHCRIKNEKAVRFRFYKKSNRLIAYADEPILIENKALGYNISYQLENFEINYRERSVFFMGYSLFTEIAKDRKSLHKKWEVKRAEAYHGSVLHFMRSLYNDQLFAEGFEVHHMQRQMNEEKLRVKNMYKELQKAKIKDSNGNINAVFNDEWSGLLSDSVDYYHKVLKQDDYKDIFGQVLLTEDSLIIQTKGDTKYLHFDDYLYVAYRYEKEEEGYAKSLSPLRNRSSYQQSYVSLINDKVITIDKTGSYFSPQDFYTYGYWGWSEKIANSLPLDYEAGK